MKIFLLRMSIVFTVLLIGDSLFSQSCGAGTIIINSQAQLNNFVATYGTCDSIVPGSKLIIDDTANDITDLTPLSNLTYINWLEIYDTDITSLAGIENISQTTMSKCVIVDNPLLTDISQLTGVQPAMSAWSFKGSPLLTDLTGLHNKTTVGTSLSLIGLGITDLDDLTNLNTIAAYLTIEDNASLSDISGLSNLIDFGAGANGGFTIRNNAVLNDCAPICALVKNLLPTRPTVTVDISGNIGDCIDEATVINTCGVTPCNFMGGNLILGSQAAVNNFQINYGPCDSLFGKLVIQDSNNNITDLSKLSTLEYSWGLSVNGCSNLTSLDGLDNLVVRNTTDVQITGNNILNDVSQLTNIGPSVSNLYIQSNPVLTDLSVVQNITSVARLRIDNMDALTDLNDFSTIDAVLTEYNISDNDLLVDITGISDFDFGYSGQSKIFTIENNPLLTDCSAVCPIVKIRLPEVSPLTTTIQNNLGSCIDEAAIIADCGRVPCNQSNVTLLTQGEVAGFQQNYGPCDSITGTLQIGDPTATNSSIVNIDFLSALEHVGSLHAFGNLQLPSLNGLQNLNMASINVLRINGNSKLESLQQLSGIGPTANTMIINDNDALGDLAGLENITTYVDELSVVNCDGLYNLDALSNATTANKRIIIRNNSLLNNISGLSGISTFATTAENWFFLYNNPMLFDCSPVCNLLNNFLPLATNDSILIFDNLGPCVDVATTINSCCDHPDYPALAAFYEAMDGPNWNDNSGWLQDCDPCGIESGTSWFGITCDVSDRVTRIEMPLNSIPNNLLSGTIPVEVFSMSELRTLNLGHSDVIGKFPEEFCSSGIHSFNVANCPNLVGPLPSCIADKTDLVSFSVINGALTGPLPEFDAGNVNLDQIRFEENNFTGPIPGSWGDLPNVMTIRIENNELSGSYNPNLSNLCPLGLLNAWMSDGNNFDAPWEDFCDSSAGQSPCGVAYTNIPDNNFEQALIDLSIDSEGTLDNCVLTSDLESVVELNLSGKDISDLLGINAFKSLERLLVDQNVVVVSEQLKGNIELIYVKGSN